MAQINWVKEIEDIKNTFEYRLEKLSLDITEDIIEMMEIKNISRKELASYLNVSKPSISKLLNEGSNITIKRLLAIAEALNCEVSIDLRNKKVKNNVSEYTDSVEYDPNAKGMVIQFKDYKNNVVNGYTCYANAS